MLSLIPSGRLSHGFVAGSQSRDGDEGEEEGPEAGDAPGAEDDAEVGCVPCEKHLHGRSGLSWGVAWVLVVCFPTFMLHIIESPSPMSISPWWP